MSKILSVGDTVSWKGGWGQDAPREAVVKHITLVEYSGTLEGKDVANVLWSSLIDRSVVVDLDNHHWAYGYQLQPVR